MIHKSWDIDEEDTGRKENGYKVTLEQTAGTNRDFVWEGYNVE